MQQCENLKKPRVNAVQTLNLRCESSACKNAERVFKARVLCTRKDKIIQPELTASAEALEKLMLHDGEQIADFNSAAAWYEGRFC